MDFVSKWLGVGVLAGILGVGCTANDLNLSSEDEAAEELLARRADIVDIEQTPVKYQSIGNCWLYATASWAESIHRTATAEEVNLSESYWTYWHWFDQIVNGRASTSISTGGSYYTASSIIRRYGWLPEETFIPEEASSERSSRQASALAAINQSLASGALKDSQARRDRALVRRELDRAWNLNADVVALLDTTFNADVSRTLSSATTSGTAVKLASELPVAYSTTPGGAVGQTTLSRAMSEWTEVYYDVGSSKRPWEVRVQKAMHDKLPVIITWFVDFNALGSKGRFADVPATPGRQGYHMTVLEDYELNDVPGFGTLPAGTVETRPEALEASLANEATMVFYRTKNSWGTFRPDREFVEGFPGYHDLYSKYLDGPVKQCRNDDPNDCPWEVTPLVSGIFPRGY